MNISKVKKLEYVEQVTITIGTKKFTISQDNDDLDTLNIWSERGHLLKMQPIACNAICVTSELDEDN